MASEGPEPSKKPTFFSNMIGTSVAAMSKLLIFQPTDTISTNAMLGEHNLSRFRQELRYASWSKRFKMLYKGGWVELLKKWPSNAYRYPVQSAAQDYLNNEHGERLIEYFGENANVASAAASGGLSAITEPFVFQPFDTLQIHQQIYQKPFFETFRSLSFTQFYRGVFVTSFLRNLPSGVMLFGGSTAVNRLMDNEDKHNRAVDLGAKSAAGFASIALSQPGDVIKVHMQANQWGFMQTLKNIPVKQFFTNGSMLRLAGGGFKMGFGFFLAEKAMNISARFFGSDDQDAPELKKARRM